MDARIDPQDNWQQAARKLAARLTLLEKAVDRLNKDAIEAPEWRKMIDEVDLNWDGREPFAEVLAYASQIEMQSDEYLPGFLAKIAAICESVLGDYINIDMWHVTNPTVYKMLSAFTSHDPAIIQSDQPVTYDWVSLGGYAGSWLGQLTK